MARLFDVPCAIVALALFYRMYVIERSQVLYQVENLKMEAANRCFTPL